MQQMVTMACLRASMYIVQIARHAIDRLPYVLAVQRRRSRHLRESHRPLVESAPPHPPPPDPSPLHCLLPEPWHAKQPRCCCRGATLKTRKRNITIPLDPGSFADAVVTIFDDAKEPDATVTQKLQVRLPPAAFSVLGASLCASCSYCGQAI